MKELCPRMTELKYKEPSNILNTKNIELVRLCRRLVECGSDSYFQCPDCEVVTRRKPYTDKVPRI